MTAARDGGVVHRAQRHDRYSTDGSNQAAVPYIRFAMAIGARSVDLGCPWREHAEGTPRHRIDRDHGPGSEEPASIRRPRSAAGQSIPRSDVLWPLATGSMANCSNSASISGRRAWLSTWHGAGHDRR